ncbi:FAD-binding oxidoreductase [Tumidithrix elongata RA019]|uniref:FAD-binding oxidoreductase n=1 Tax=Tumidithrix elongata BACA0141 TaxID=2716417 RepID=A0AAW9PTT0_9CYAN|nr:FAD-binding oxidoreductase [Tumidithrix elongata RA019]
MATSEKQSAGDIAASFADIVGLGNVQTLDLAEPHLKTQIANSTMGVENLAIVSPKTQTELASAIALANQQQWGVLPYGNASKLTWGGLVRGANVAISTAGCDRLIEHCVGDLTVTVEAGMKFADLQKILAQEGQYCAIDPAYPNAATIGGIVATANTGSLRQRYGGLRDMCLGISFVRSDGELVKAGGRVVKNVAGYDLMKLLTGAYGTLGVISQLTFRLYPLPEAKQTVLLTGKADAIAELRNKILSSTLTPTVLDLLSSSLLKELGFGQDTGKEIGLVARFETLKVSVIEQSDRLVELGKSLHLKAEVLSEAENFWQRLEDLVWQPSPQSSLAGNSKLIVKLGVLPSKVVNILVELEAIARTLSESIPQPYVQIHGAGGLGTLRFDLAGGFDPQDLLLKIRHLANDTGGFLTILEAPPALKQNLDVWGYTGNAIGIMQRIKQQFDPHHLLSPHRLFI